MKNLLKEINETIGLEIIEKSFEEIPLFDVSYKQPFKFGIHISYNSIKGQGSFEFNFPSFYVKSFETNSFLEEINKVVEIVNKLNKTLKENYSIEWVRQ
jgi:hypothetical protein